MFLFIFYRTGPKEQQSGETALEGLLNISLHGIDPALRYSIEHALQAVVCLKKLARVCFFIFF
ncbi:unnamed protein product [Meloidogyne enterolobii]|uniref:Uncharacterized protein n=1 Tax=Meloidogyne enterolobii TaxID=390850 RepID=A0ACB0YK57_MELEN